MASRFARQTLQAGARASVRAKPASRFVARRWNSTSHAQEKSSDLPWIIGSAVVFGPALLYLLSPSSRKTAPAPHAAHGHDAHAPKEVVIKDDEGTPANVTSEVNAAIAEDAPKADGAEVKADTPVVESSPEETEVKEAAPPEAPQTPPTPEGTGREKGSDDDSTLKAGVNEPKDLGEAREASKEGSAPKKAET